MRLLALALLLTACGSKLEASPERTVKLVPITDTLCVTKGVAKVGTTINEPTMRAVAPGTSGDGASLDFTYRGDTASSRELASGSACPIATTVYDEGKTAVVHVPAEGGPTVAPGEPVRAVLDWDTRSRLMRVHTCLHLLCALVKFPVTGGQVGVEEGRLDFDIEDASIIK